MKVYELSGSNLTTQWPQLLLVSQTVYFAYALVLTTGATRYLCSLLYLLLNHPFFSFFLRSKTEVGMIQKAIYQAEKKDKIKEELNPDLAEKRRALEANQNAEHLERLSRGEGTEPIKYGDIVQLQHVKSGLFVATHKTPAPLNPSCRKVTLKAGSFACQFRILPRFKVK
jgi:hypothetical protein